MPGPADLLQFLRQVLDPGDDPDTIHNIPIPSTLKTGVAGMGDDRRAVYPTNLSRPGKGIGSFRVPTSQTVNDAPSPRADIGPALQKGSPSLGQARQVAIGNALRKVPVQSGSPLAASRGLVP